MIGMTIHGSSGLWAAPLNATPAAIATSLIANPATTSAAGWALRASRRRISSS